jgi:Xaa-Pro aminopeptidase
MARMEGGLAVITSAITDYRNLRITQLRFKLVASDLARGWGDRDKILYVNYPCFTNLNEPATGRLEFIDRLQQTTGELDLRDADKILDRLRMVVDELGLRQLRRAIEITGKGLMEGMKLARPGLTTKQIMEGVDYVYRVDGSSLGFVTGAAMNHYSADIQRTVPSGDRFTDEQ